MDLRQIKNLMKEFEDSKIHKLEIDSEFLPVFQKTANMFKEPLHKAILNIDFFDKLDIDKLQSLSDVIKYTFNGLINNNQNHLFCTICTLNPASHSFPSRRRLL